MAKHVHKYSKHTHKYRLVPFGNSIKVWSCGLPDCSHYMPTHMSHMIEGKASECWDCANITVMSSDRMKFAITQNEGKILCQDCIDIRRGIPIKSNELADIDAIINDMKAVNRK